MDRIFAAAFAEGARSYKFFMMIDGEEHIAKVPTCDLLGEPITSSGNTVFASFVKELQSLAWIEHGRNHFHEKANGLCPYCRQPLPSDYEQQLASCYDEQYQRAIDTIKSFPAELPLPHGCYLQYTESCYGAGNPPGHR